MSTSVSDHQRNKGQGSSGNQSYAKSNSTKDHHAGDHEDGDSWRNQQGHHQGYGSDNMQSYYGSFQQQPYPNHSYGVNEAGGPWSNNGGEMFVGGGGGGYSGMHESGGGGHYNADGVFSGGNGGSFGNFGAGQPGYGYGGYGNGDYNAWGPQQPRKQHYDEYYREGMYGDERNMKMIEQGMGGLGMDKDLKEFKELMSMQGGGGGQKKTTWATIASQPAKPQSISKKSKPGMPLPPMIPGAWESKNGVSKTPMSAPVQAPAWERPKIPPPPMQTQPPPSQQMPPPLGNQNIPPSRGYHTREQPPPMSYVPPQTHLPNPPMQNSHSQNSHSQQVAHSNGNHHTAAASAPSPPGPKYPDEMKMKDYNPATFDLLAEGARFFVIKSYSEDDIHRSIKYEIWCSTEHGNKRLDEAFKERKEAKGIIYLFFSVNGSGHFCGMAQMISPVDYHAKASVWSQDKWKGQFKVKWIYVKDVPNSALRHIRLENNEGKPVTNSRDTQEVPLEKGKLVLKILHSFHNTTSIFDDFIHYEKRQEEEAERKVVVQQPPPPPMHNNMRGDRGGRGGFQDRGVFRGGGSHHHGGPPTRGDHDGRGEPREFRDRDPRGGRDGGFAHPRNDNRGGERNDYSRERPDREHFHSFRDDRGERDVRDREPRGGHRGRPPMMRN